MVSWSLDSPPKMVSPLADIGAGIDLREYNRIAIATGDTARQFPGAPRPACKTGTAR